MVQKTSSRRDRGMYYAAGTSDAKAFDRSELPRAPKGKRDAQRNQRRRCELRLTEAAIRSGRRGRRSSLISWTRSPDLFHMGKAGATQIAPTREVETPL